ncbi:histidine kinase [Actinoplanes sp. NEAU-A11]|uniref:histidine kinase n=2 Tax=Actinoplanes aureus TaxID=2792083 RepID=A0A931G083_9ACTN|nr:histidine kinase [Actinoplanes aureus]
MLHQGGLGSDSDGYRSLDLTGFLLAVASVAPLVWARRAPGVAFAVSAAATLALIPYPLDVPPGLLIATYMLAEAVGGGDTPRRRLWAAVSVAAFVPLTMTLMLLGDASLSSMSSGMVAWATMFALVWTAGDRSRLRRDRIAELEVHARLRDQELRGQRRLAAAQERTRIARELHDSAGHAINVILVQAGAARLLHDRDPERSLRAIETIEEVAQSTIADIDRLVRALREDTGLAAPAPAGTTDLEQLVDRHRAGGLEVSTRFDGAPRGLPSGVAWAAYRILQEALTNAARHGSGRADVRMSYGESAVEILVRNPVGDRNRPGGGMGIVGMRERAALLDGTLEVHDEGAGMFRLRARLPYDPPATAGAVA